MEEGRMFLAILLAVLWIAMLVIHILYYANNRNDRYNKLALLFALAAAVVCMIMISSSGQSESAGGAYIYYVNGVRVASGIMVFGKNLFLSLFGGVLANFSAMGVAYLVTGHLKIGPWLIKLAIFLILFGAMTLCIALVFLFNASSPTSDIEAGKILLIIGIITLSLGISSAVIYKKRS